MFINAFIVPEEFWSWIYFGKDKKRKANGLSCRVKRQDSKESWLVALYSK